MCFSFGCLLVFKVFLAHRGSLLNSGTCSRCIIDTFDLFCNFLFSKKNIRGRGREEREIWCMSLSYLFACHNLLLGFFISLFLLLIFPCYLWQFGIKSAVLNAELPQNSRLHILEVCRPTSPII